MNLSDTTIDLGDIDSTVLIFGGSYSNLAATQALLTEAKNLGIDKKNIMCTGDIVAYGAEPEQCCQLIRESDIHLLMGNCEESLAQRSDNCGCGFEDNMLCSSFSKDWYHYAQSQVSDASRAWMKTLPRLIKFNLKGHICAVTHGSLTKINRFIYASTETGIKQYELEKAGCHILIGGHCGIPFGQKINDKLWLNAGAIGLPANDGTTDGWYLLLQPELNAIKVSWHRLAYDYQHSFQSMFDAGLNDYANSIKSGLWPSMDVLPDKERLQQGIRIQPKNMVFSNV